MKNKKLLKKINSEKRSIFAKTLSCYCACKGTVAPAATKGYLENNLSK